MIFVTSPYSHVNKAIIHGRVAIVSEYMAKLLNQGISCISPIPLGTTILQFAKLPADFAFWKKLSFELIDISGELHVLMLDGWDTSEGVIAEIAYATEKKLKIIYLTYEDVCKS